MKYLEEIPHLVKYLKGELSREGASELERRMAYKADLRDEKEFVEVLRESIDVLEDRKKLQRYFERVKRRRRFFRCSFAILPLLLFFAFFSVKIKIALNNISPKLNTPIIATKTLHSNESDNSPFIFNKNTDNQPPIDIDSILIIGETKKNNVGIKKADIILSDINEDSSIHKTDTTRQVDSISRIKQLNYISIKSENKNDLNIKLPKRKNEINSNKIIAKKENKINPRNNSEQNIFSVGLMPLTYVQHDQAVASRIVSHHLEEVLSKISNIKLVDLDTWDYILKERNLQKTEEFDINKTIDKGKSVGVHKLVYGNVIKSEETQTKDGYIQITINIELGIADIETGKTQARRDFKFSGVSVAAKADMLSGTTGQKKVGGIISDYGTFSGEAELTSHMSSALENLDKELVDFLLNQFGGKLLEKPKKQSGSIKLPSIELCDFLKEKENDLKFNITGTESEKTILIYGSKNQGIRKKSRLALVKEREVSTADFNGNNSICIEQIILAEFKLKEYRGDFSLLEINKNTKTTISEILQNRNQDDKMYIVFLKK